MQRRSAGAWKAATASAGNYSRKAYSRSLGNMSETICTVLQGLIESGAGIVETMVIRAGEYHMKKKKNQDKMDLLRLLSA